MNDDNKEFTISVIETLASPWTDVGIDLLEESVDELVNSEALKEIPFVKTGIALCKAGIHIRDKHLLKQTLEFVNTFNDGSISEEKLKKYRKKLQEDPKWAKKETEHILVLLDSHINDNQSIRLAKFYQAYTKGAVDWNKFCELAEANTRIFETDFQTLCGIYSYQNGNLKNNYRGSRLVSVGLLETKAMNLFTGTIDAENNTYTVSTFGKTFLQHLGVI